MRTGLIPLATIPRASDADRGAIAALVQKCLATHDKRYSFKDQIYVRRNAKSKPALSADEAASWWPKRQREEI